MRPELSFQPYRIVLGAGDSKQIHATGDFIRVSQAPAQGILVEAKNGVRVPMVQGDSIKAPDKVQGFTDIRVTNNAATTETIILLIGTGDFTASAIAGVVQIDDSTPIDVQVSGSISEITEPLAPHEFKTTDGMVLFHGATVPSSANETIVPPASNLNGIIIKAYSIYGFTQYISLIADTAAPIDYKNFSPNGFLLTSEYAYTSGARRGDIGFDLPFKVPAGLGLYISSNASNNLYGGMIYEVL